MIFKIEYMCCESEFTCLKLTLCNLKMNLYISKSVLYISKSMLKWCIKIVNVKPEKSGKLTRKELNSNSNYNN